MKYSASLYSQAFLLAMDETPKTQRGDVSKRFIETVRKNGDFSRIDSIVKAIEKAWVQNKGGKYVKVEFARELPESQVKKISSKFSSKDTVETFINPQLVAGVRITIDGERELDQTMARNLNRLFIG